MLKRWMQWTTWILGAVLVCVSLDTIPDPPAVHSHAVTVKGSAPSDRSEGLCQFESGPWRNLIAPVQAHTILFGNIEPVRPTAITAKMGQAADPSPPVARPALAGRSQA